MNKVFGKLVLLSTLTVLIVVGGVYALDRGPKLDVLSVRAEATGGPVYIMADGSVYPSSAPILRNGDNYTLIGNLTSDADGIVIERNNMTLDGAGFSLQGPEVEIGTDSGVDLSYGNNITIENVEISGFSRGFLLNNSLSNTICRNNITNCYYGVILSSSSSNYISGNSMIGNGGGAVSVDIVFSSSNNSVSENNITNGYVDGSALYGYAGVQIVGCSSNNVSENNITNNDYGVYLSALSNNNTILGNTIASNDRYGIILWQSNYNSISGNSMTANYNASIALEGSSNNTISGNSMTDSGCGVNLEAFGLGSSNNIICENNITDNVAGIIFSYSSGNVFYNNNFVNNIYQVRSDNISANAWDDGSSGNYWSDYSIQYPNATEIGNSGIWNTSYVIDANNTDHYPLTRQYSVIPELPSFFILPLFMLATLLAVTVYRRKGTRNTFQTRATIART